MLARELTHHQPLVRRLVVFGVFEAQRERREAPTGSGAREAGDERAVEAARYVTADRHVGAEHSETRGSLELVAHRGRGILDASSEAGARIARLIMDEVAHQAALVDAR